MFCDGAVEHYTPKEIKAARDKCPVCSKSEVYGWFPTELLSSDSLNENHCPEMGAMVRWHIKNHVDSLSEDLKSQVDMEMKFLKECGKLNVDKSKNLKMAKVWGWTKWDDEEEGDEEEEEEEGEGDD